MKSVRLYQFSLDFAAIVITVATLNAPITAGAADSTTTLAAPAATSTTGMPSPNLPKLLDSTIHAGYKSYNNSGYASELATGRRYYYKNEFYLSGKHSSGWGLKATAVATGSQFADNRKDSSDVGDPSLTLTHPALYDNGTVSVSGQLREYFPASRFSLNRGIHHHAYYNLINVKLVQGMNFFNQAVIRAFTASTTKPSDTSLVEEAYSELTIPSRPWLKFGVGQITLVEEHYGTGTGTSIQAFPFMELRATNEIKLAPKLLLPVYKVGEVYQTPKAVALDNVQIQVEAQIGL